MKKIALFLLFSLLFSAPVYAERAQLLSIKDSSIIENQLQLEFELSEKSVLKPFLLTEPNLLVVDLADVQLAENFIFSAENSPYIEKLRRSQNRQQGLRVVFDFKADVTPEVIDVKKNALNDKQLLLAVTLDSMPNNNENEVFQLIDEQSFDVENNREAEAEAEAESHPFFSDWEITGKLAAEELGFFHNGLDPRQHNNYLSGSFEPEWYKEWDDGKQSFTFVPFYRYSQHDNKRTHFDIRELTWLLSEQDWEIRVGFRKVFWGVAEGLHLVNIINQTDLVENTDTEDKMGQPMVNLALIREWGTLDLFILPGFRERTFPGVEGRLRTFPEVSVGEAEYEHYGFKKHMAYAMRWSKVIGDWDVGLSHFHGTSREPAFRQKLTPTGVSLIPYYDLINQTGLDLQLTYEDWIVKHEGIVREGQGHTFYAMTTGIEYTLFDLFRTGLDLGLVVEYMYDTRGANNFLAPFQDDILTALRFGFNDVQSTEILAGVMFDRTNNSKYYNIEASRRFGDSFKVDIEMRLFSGAPTQDPSYFLRDDDHVRMEIGYYF